MLINNIHCIIAKYTSLQYVSLSVPVYVQGYLELYFQFSQFHTGFIISSSVP